MKNKTLEKFLDWFERSPTYKTIWVAPFVLLLGLIAWGINKLKGNS